MRGYVGFMLFMFGLGGLGGAVEGKGDFILPSAMFMLGVALIVWKGGKRH